MNNLEETRIKNMQNNGVPTFRRTVYVVPTVFDQTPQGNVGLPRMDQYVTNYHIVQWVASLYEAPFYGWPSWAEHDMESADFYFSSPYVQYAQDNLGYGPANAVFNQGVQVNDAQQGVGNAEEEAHLPQAAPNEPSVVLAEEQEEEANSEGEQEFNE